MVGLGEQIELPRSCEHAIKAIYYLAHFLILSAEAFESTPNVS